MLLRITIGGFPLSQETAAAIEAAKEDRLLFRCTFDVQQGGIDTASTYLADKRTPKLLIVESNAAGDQLFQQLEALAGVCDPDTRLILIGSQNDIALFRALTEMGVSDYLVAPVTAEALRDSIVKVYAGENIDFDGRTIGFVGMAGGVGSSVLAHNVANQLANEKDEKVVVVDLDIPYGTAALNFNMQPRQTIIEAIAQMNRGGESGIDQFFMPFETNVSILASPATLGSGVQLTSEILDRLLTTVKPTGEYIVLDIPHLWTPWVIDAMTAVDDLVLVARPDLTNLRNAKNVVEFLGTKRGADAPTRLVLNQVGAAKRADLSASDFNDALALRPDVEIPYDPEAFGKALNNGEMLSKAAAKSKATLAVADLGSIVTGEGGDEEEGAKKLLSLFRRSKKSG